MIQIYRSVLNHLFLILNVLTSISIYDLPPDIQGKHPDIQGDPVQVGN